MTDYRRIADDLATEIASGRLRPGDRLPPQRDFARERKIAASTASRVYRELRRRGLTVGEVGRGTFVKATGGHSPFTFPDQRRGMVDLQFNVGVLPEQVDLLSRSLTPLLKRPSAFESALGLVTASARPEARQTTAAFLSRPGWEVDPELLCFAGNGKQAVAAAIAALVPIGNALGVEAFTYPLVKTLTAGMGIELVPLAMDAEGMRPDALEAAHRKSPFRAIYLQPTLHNPLGMTMTANRREEIGAVLRQLDVVAIEDSVYAFLDDSVLPLAATVPTHAIYIDSMSKRVSPGVTIGVIVPPPALVEPLRAAIRSGFWLPFGLPMELCLRWMSDGTLKTLEDAKRLDAKARQALVRETFPASMLESNPLAAHAWLLLPDWWRAETFVSAAAQRGISVIPAAAFAVGPAHAPSAVRIALVAPPIDVLGDALRTLAELTRQKPAEWHTE